MRAFDACALNMASPARVPARVPLSPGWRLPAKSMADQQRTLAKVRDFLIVPTTTWRRQLTHCLESFSTPMDVHIVRGLRRTPKRLSGKRNVHFISYAT